MPAAALVICRRYLIAVPRRVPSLASNPDGVAVCTV
jgi:hypothetical protein